MVTNSQPDAAAPANATALTNSTAGAAASSQKRDVYVTGFGKFGDILRTPRRSWPRSWRSTPK